MGQDRFETLRAILYEPPSEQGWQRLSRLFEGWPEDQDAALGVAYAQEVIGDWPARLRTAPLGLGFELVLYQRGDDGHQWRFGAVRRPPHPAWALVRVLDLRPLVGGLTSDDAAALGAWPWLASIHTLEAGRALAGAWGVNSDRSAEALVSSPHLDHLEILRLPHNRLGPRAAEAVARRNRFVRLRRLDLSHNPLGDLGTTYLSLTRTLGYLQALGLTAVGMRAPGARALSRAHGLRAVQTLSLSKNPIGDDGLSWLLGSPLFENLQRLDLRQTGLTQAGALMLADDARLSSLLQLDLSTAGLTRAARLAVDESPHIGDAIRWHP